MLRNDHVQKQMLCKRTIIVYDIEEVILLFQLCTAAFLHCFAMKILI